VNNPIKEVGGVLYEPYSPLQTEILLQLNKFQSLLGLVA